MWEEGGIVVILPGMVGESPRWIMTFGQGLEEDERAIWVAGGRGNSKSKDTVAGVCLSYFGER